MESGVDSYLHKKFKKQLSIDPKIKKNEKENKDYGNSETCEEKNKIISNEDKNYQCLDVVENQKPDNNECVPNQSTNQHTSTSSFALKSNFPMSSISVENCIVTQSSNPCISYVVSNHINDDRIHGSFDIKYNDTTNVFNTSSISTTENIYTNKSPYPNEDLQVYDYTIKNDETMEPKPEEVQPPPDKNSSGKYVCPYCSLVCSKPSVLQKHIRAHTNERPYPCKSCGFSFKTRSNLYKHCRSRTHANRVMGNKVQDTTNEMPDTRNLDTPLGYSENREEQTSQKPYKPRFHTGHQYDNIAKENIEKTNHSKHPTSEMISHHINEIINKKSSINSADEEFIKKIGSEDMVPVNRELRIIYLEPNLTPCATEQKYTEEPLNLTNKNRKRTMSEITEPVIQKSLIKELLLKSLSSSDLQCQYCKMIFQTVTELDVHKYRNCKGKPSDVKYTRSSSVNVASILTQNKNAFDNIPHLQNTVFPLNSPGPFLGKTRLIDSDKTKSFSFDSGTLPLASPSDPAPNYLSPLPFDKDKKAPIKLFGGEVKVHTTGESYKMDSASEKFECDSKYIEYGGKLSENRVIKCSLQSGGTVLTNKTDYNKHELKNHQEFIKVYEGNCNSPNFEMSNFNKQNFTFDGVTMNNNSKLLEANDVTKVRVSEDSPINKYCTMLDFGQNAVKMLTPNIKQPNFSVSNLLLPGKSVSNISFDNSSEIKLSSPKPKTETILQSNVDFPKRPILSNQIKFVIERKPPNNLYNPLSLVVDGKIIRHVPGMPGPVVAAEPDIPYENAVIAVTKSSQELLSKPSPIQERPHNIKLPLEAALAERESEPVGSFTIENRNSENASKVLDTKLGIKITESKVIDIRSSDGERKKFARPNSLALKPTTAALKQHHGLTPTMFNQILISPDTPRVAKKYAQHFLHGNYFSYLGLKSSTKPVYCTLNKTQPFYVPHFKKLSMYSEWRQQDTKQDKLYASNYDTRQRNNGYSVAGKTTANLIIHSSYKFMVSEISTSISEKGEDQPKTNFVIGGYECNDDYTYIRGRGRGRYVCDQCGIRCKKPSMLKKHIRTHSNDRPYTCNHCNFSFKTKGNLTKHMKSKAHTKNYTASGGSSSSTQHSNQSSESDTEDSGMDSSDESTRQQEHEAAYGLLSLSQKPTSSTIISSDSDLPLLRSGSPNDFPISSEEVAQVSKTNYARNKFLNDRSSLTINSKKINEVFTSAMSEETTEAQNIRNYLGKCISRPLTYPYTSILLHENEVLSSPKPVEVVNRVPNPISVDVNIDDNSVEPRSVIQQFHVIQKYTSQTQLVPPKTIERNTSPKKFDQNNVILNNKRNLSPNHVLTPTLKLNDLIITNENVTDLRKRKISVLENVPRKKIQRNDEVIDLSMTTATHEKSVYTLEERVFNNTKLGDPPKNVANEIYNTLHKVVPSPQRYDVNEDKDNFSPKSSESTNSTVIIVRNFHTDEPMNNNFIGEKIEHRNNMNNHIKLKEYDNSAMETLADVATKQVKLEKNTLAKCVASEYLKLATKNENIDRDVCHFGPVNKDVNDLIVKSEGNRNCTVCFKNFNKHSQLRLHMNIHYLERPYRCESCSVSFRTKGHLQKHERSASHHNKLSSSPAFSSSEPRPFKCSDCNIAFRIHGHLAKHLRSKMHIMKLECLSKIPFGLYAELERSNSLLTEINTTDGDQCLESLKTLAKKVFINNPSKLNQLAVRDDVNSVDLVNS